MIARPPFKRNGGAAYIAAVIITLAAIGARLASFDMFSGYPFVTVFPAVVLSTVLGGPGPGLLTLALGGISAWYFFIPPFHSFQPKTTSDSIGMALYVAVSGFLVFVLTWLETIAEREREGRARLGAMLEEKSVLLRERELLLTEVRHRVGNNLQQITGLLMLHARQIPDSVAKEAFENAKARIDLFAEVHQSLYSAGNETVQLNGVLSKLATRLVSAHRPVGVACRVEVTTDYDWKADKAVPVIMVAHELICNALEHGFGTEGNGTIMVSLGRTSGGLVRLAVTDDGSGLPPEFDAEQTNSLGLSIIRAFARQLGGTFGLYAHQEGRGTVGELVFDDGMRATPANASPRRIGKAA